ncbi:hypothetical protein EG68_11788 [Paragonimus skrjabini miyazakii]|uniref:Uncharacterized protein n=1 Tax=Paragonimus skrjabini miyazakii TaxID=59628 RepID=A0A8S9YDA9_9TREM|nr:hypothetical protein EG68_11788 [Paragonimus skrjabini miyazakii]
MSQNQSRQTKIIDALLWILRYGTLVHLRA